MAEKELILRLRVDNAEAKAATKATIEGFQNAEREAGKSSQAQRQRIKEVWTDTETAERAKSALIDRTNKEKLAALVKVMQAEKDAGQVGVQSMKQVEQAGTSGFSNIAGSMALATAGLGKLIELAGTFGQAVTAAQTKSRDLASSFISDRDKLRDLATMMGVKSDSAFTLDNAKFNVNAAFRTDEGLGFRSSFQGSGAQYAGKSMSQAEFKEYEQKAAALVAARGLDPSVGGDVFGKTLGLKDFTKFGANAAEQALGTGNAALAVLGRGSGDNSVLARQYAMLSSAVVNEDDLKGSIQDPIEAAAMVSAAAEKSQAQAAELSMMSLRGIRDFKNPLIQRAKITAQTSPIEAYKKLAPLVEDEAKKRGIKTEDVLRENFKDVGTAEAIAVMLNKGVSGGIFDDRMNYAKGFNANTAQQTIQDFQNSEAGQARIADSKIKEAEAKRGAKNSALEIVRRQVLAQMIDDKQIDTSATNVKDYLADKATFGVLGSTEQLRIDEAVKVKLMVRGAAAGVRMPSGDRGNFTPEARENYLNSAIDNIKGAGFNPLTGQRDGQPQQADPELAKLMREQNSILKMSFGVGAVPAALPAAPASSMKRT